MPISIKHKRGSASAITSANPTLAAGELAFETDTRRFKIGDGTTAWGSLGYVTPYVSTTDRLLGRSSAGAGDVEEIVCTSFGRSLIDDADAAAALSTLGAAPTASPAFTGNATITASSGIPLTLNGNSTALRIEESSGETIDIYRQVSDGLLYLDANQQTFCGFVFRTTPTGGSVTERLRIKSTGESEFTGSVVVNNTGNVVPLTITNTGTENSFVVNDASGDTSPFVIDASGNVVIGQTTGNCKLVVAGTNSNISGARATYEGTLQINEAGSFNLDATLGIEFKASVFGSGYGVKIAGLDDGSFVIGNRANSAAWSERLRINQGGQLLVTAGSGTGPSSYKPGIAVSGDDDTGVQQIGGANTISLVTGGSERVRVDASGNVGIGAAPGARLHVNTGTDKNFHVRAGIRLSGSAIQSIQDNNATDSPLELYTQAQVQIEGNPITFYNNGEHLRIASDGVITMPAVYGDTVGATNRDLFIDDTGKLGYVSSIRASKTGITAIDDVSWLRDLTPVSFHYRRRNEDGTYSEDTDGTLDYGLIAEEVEPVAPEMCFYDVVDGEPQLRGVHYSKLITPMLRYIQQLEARIAALEERLNHA